MNVYTEENLIKMSVHTLRVILRSEFGGVPGICNKNELISQILNIQSGEDAPVRSTKGRKPLGEFITPINNEIVLADPSAEKVEGIVRGVVEVNNSGYAFLKVKNNDGESTNYFISKNLVKKYALRSGEEVEGVSQFSDEIGSVKIVAINLVNGKTPDNERSDVDFSQLKPQYPIEKHNLTTQNAIIRAMDVFCPLGKGQRCLVEDRTGKFGTEFAKILSSSIEDSVKSFVIFVGAKAEDVANLEQKANKEIVVLPITCESEEVLRAVNLTVERAKVLAINGEDVVVIIDNLSSIFSSYEDFADSQKNVSGFVNANSSARKYLQGLFSVGGCFGQGKSITVVAVASPEKDSQVFGELASLATSYVKLEPSDILQRRGFVINLKDSYTDKDELLLTSSDIEYADRERKKICENSTYSQEIYRELLK